jgi:hypothetical protein
MAQKKPLNLSVPAELLDEFYAVCEHYGHAKQKGQVLSAALLMFLRSDPAEQGRCLEQIVSAEINAGVSQMLDRARKEQGLRVATREAAEHAASADAGEAEASPGEPAADAPTPSDAPGDAPSPEPPATPLNPPAEAEPTTPKRHAARRAGQSKRPVNPPAEPGDAGDRNADEQDTGGHAPDDPPTA